MQKSTVAQIRERFDQDVERFSNLETGQSATIDAPLAMSLITGAAATICPEANTILDIGCGAGNYTLKLLERLPNRDVMLLDLSQPMLTRAEERIRAVSSGSVTPHQADIREIELAPESLDIVMAAAGLHHLRGEEEWRQVFGKIYRALKPGGCFWISDLIHHSVPAIQAMMWQRYGEYLSDFKDEAYRDHVFDYVAKEDSPRPLMFQLDMLREVGFAHVDVLHKNVAQHSAVV